MSDNEYNSIKKSDWNLKQALDYLSKDIESLLEIMDKFNRYILVTYLQITDGLTISRLGMNIIKSKYLSQKS